MSDRNGFTLIEVIIVLIIISILTAITLPNYNTYVQQGAAKAAQNNLITIYNAQKSYFLSPTGSSTYCIAGCDTLSDINLPANLNLTIVDNYFTYACSALNGFTCTATNRVNLSFTMTVINKPIVLLGATTCTTGNMLNCNPSCTNAANPNYCPGVAN